MNERTGFSNNNYEPGGSPKSIRSALFTSYAEVSAQNDGATGNHFGLQTGQAPLPAIKKQALLSRLRDGYQKIRQDFAVKVNDGLMPAAVLIMLTLLYDLIFLTIARSINSSTMLIVILLLIALGALTLERSIQARSPQAECAFQGMLAGMFFWFSANTALRLAPSYHATQSIAVIILMVAMIVIALWKIVFPTGVKFFSVVFLLNWIGRFLLSNPLSLLGNWNYPVDLLAAFGWIALICTVLLTFWLFLGSKYHIQRSWIGISIWFGGILTISLFFGWPL